MSIAIASATGPPSAAAAQAHARRRLRAVDSHPTGTHPFLQTAARVIRQQPHQDLVEPLAGQFRGYLI
jgi:hypothetical protein